MPSMTKPRIDALDARILLALDEDPTASVLALARTLGVARNTVHARLGRLEGGGMLQQFSRRLDPAALGYTLVALVSISVTQTKGDAADAGLFGIPEIVEVHSTTGDADLVAKVVAKDTADLHRITRDILAVEGIERTSTVISLLEVMPLRLEALLTRLAAGEAQR
jgi:DNA-binding Lrp family transcriptional regulator